MQSQKAELEHKEGVQVRTPKPQLQTVLMLLKEHPGISRCFISGSWLMTLIISQSLHLLSIKLSFIFYLVTLVTKFWPLGCCFFKSWKKQKLYQPLAALEMWCPQPDKSDAAVNLHLHPQQSVFSVSFNSSSTWIYNQPGLACLIVFRKWFSGYGTALFAWQHKYANPVSTLRGRPWR